MTLIDMAVKLRPLIEKAVQSLDEADSIEATTLFSKWSGNSVAYEAGQKVQYEGVLYKVLTTHTSQADWTPTAAPSLFAEVLIPDSTVIPEWKQPDSTNPYMLGDKVTYNGKTYVSTVDNNVWEPTLYGWEEVT